MFMDMEAKVFLFFNAAIYLTFSIWCFLLPSKSSKFLGFALISKSGKSEFLAVYAGLELAMSIYFFLSAVNESLQTSGILFGALMYGCITILRTISIIRFGMVEGGTIGLMITEAVLGIWALEILFGLFPL